MRKLNRGMAAAADEAERSVIHAGAQVGLSADVATRDDDYGDH